MSPKTPTGEPPPSLGGRPRRPRGEQEGFSAEQPSGAVTGLRVSGVCSISSDTCLTPKPLSFFLLYK